MTNIHTYNMYSDTRCIVFSPSVSDIGGRGCTEVQLLNMKVQLMTI